MGTGLKKQTNKQTNLTKIKNTQITLSSSAQQPPPSLSPSTSPKACNITSVSSSTRSGKGGWRWEVGDRGWETERKDRFFTMLNT